MIDNNTKKGRDSLDKKMVQKCTSLFEEFRNTIEDLQNMCSSNNKHLDYYLIPLELMDKRPEMGCKWKTDRKQSELSLEDARKRIRKKLGNVGVVGTNDYKNPNYDENTITLGILDIDLDKNGRYLLPEEKISELFEALDTFTIKTRSGGYHLYFAASIELSRTFHQKYGTKNPHPKYLSVEFGEIRLNNQYVVSVGSYVPFDSEHQKKGHRPDATGIYEIFLHKPIRIITEEDFPQWITFQSNSSANKSSTKIKDTEESNSIIQINNLSDVDDVNQFLNNKGITLSQIREKDEELNRMLLGANEHSNRSYREGRSDKSATDFYVVHKLKDNGFSPDQAALILRRCRAYYKTFRDDYLEITIGKVYSSGSTPTYNPSEIEFTEENTTNIISDNMGAINSKITFQVCDTLPDEIPNTPIVLIHAPPRVGKTHKSVQWMINEKSANYVTHSHSVAGHAAEICEKLMPDNKSAIHLEGKSRCCRHGNILSHGCESCPLYPFGSEQSSKSIYLDVQKLLKKHRLLHRGNIPEKLCPYHALKIAETIVDYCFTVVQYLNKLQKRDLLVLDEDSTIAQLYPSSLQIADRVYTKNRHLKSNIIGEYLPEIGNKSVLDLLNDKIDAKIQLLNLDDLDDEENYETLLACDALYYCVDIIREIYKACDPQIEEQKAIVEKLNEINFTLPECDRILAYKIVNEMLLDLGFPNKTSKTSLLFEPLLFPCEARRFHWAGSNHVKLFWIADEEHRIVDIPNKTKIVIIGDTRADLLVNELEQECTTIIVPKFPFSNQFVLVLLSANNTEEHREMMQYIFHKLNPNPNDPVRVPSLVLTSSKKEQERLTKTFKSVAVMSEKEGREGQRWNHAYSGMNIFYANSVISRGIDVEFYDIIFIYGSNFTIPYYEALRCYAKETEDKDCNLSTYKKRIKDITTDETTNCLLRISPTNAHSDNKARIVFMAESEIWKIKPEVLEGMKVVSMNPYSVPDSKWLEIQRLRGHSLMCDGKGSYHISNTTSSNHEDQTADHFADLLNVTPQELHNWALDQIPTPVKDDVVQQTKNFMKQRLLKSVRDKKSGQRLSNGSLTKWMLKEFGNSKNLEQTAIEVLISHMVVSGILRREEDIKHGKTMLSYRMKSEEYNKEYWSGTSSA